MSRGDGRALERAAEALSERAIAKGPHDGWLLDTTQAIIDSYLDALLEELPPEAERAAHDALDVVDGRNWAGATRTEMLDAILPAFLLSLRSSSRGAKTDED